MEDYGLGRAGIGHTFAVHNQGVRPVNKAQGVIEWWHDV